MKDEQNWSMMTSRRSRPSCPRKRASSTPQHLRQSRWRSGILDPRVRGDDTEGVALPWL